MLIRSLRAENFMKFESLRIENLPRDGVVGIEGPNESGKSTIAEAILFAIYGQTRDDKSCPIDHLIRWGGDSLRVELEFEIPAMAEQNGDYLRYLIYREIDRFGTNYVRVLSLPDREELASGNVAVRDFLDRKLQVDVTEYQRAFFSRQAADRGHFADIVDDMSGVSELLAASEKLRKEVGQLEREGAHHQKDIVRNLAQMDKYSWGVEKLPEIETRLSAVEEKLEGSRALILHSRESTDRGRQKIKDSEAREKSLSCLPTCKLSELLSSTDEIVQAYEDAGRDDSRLEDDIAAQAEIVSGLEDIRAVFAQVAELGKLVDAERNSMAELIGPDGATGLEARSLDVSSRAANVHDRCRRLRVGLRIFGSLFVLATGAAAIFGFVPEAESWVESSRDWAQVIGLVALGSLALAASQMLRIGKARAVLEAIRDDSNSLETRLTESRETLVFLDSLSLESGKLSAYVRKGSDGPEGAVRERFRSFGVQHSKFLAPGRGGKGTGLSKFIAGLARREKQARDKLKDFLQSLSRDAKGEEASVKKLQSDVQRLENERRDARAQMDKREDIRSANVELEATAQEIRDRIDDRLCACDLIQDVIITLRVKVAPNLARLVRSVLPQLTSGRYRDVKISDDLDIQVFAPERSDFLPISELSGGTAEALLLALRLAFAQSFASVRTRRPHSVILDEPFKMMDLNRAMSAVEIFRRLSPDLVQFIIIQPAFSEEQRQLFDFLVSTKLEDKRLEICRAPTSLS